MGKYEDAKLRTFVSAARLGSFTQAARSLGITQPAVSQQIGDLERMYGAELFVRGRGEVALTEAGEHFLGYAEKILDAYGEVDALFGSLTASGRSVGRVNVAATSFCATHVLPRLVEDIVAVSGLDLITNTYPESEFLSVMPPAGADLQLFTATREEVLDGGLEKYAQSSLTLPSGEKWYICFRPTPGFSGTALCRILLDRLLKL